MAMAMAMVMVMVVVVMVMVMQFVLERTLVEKSTCGITRLAEWLYGRLVV
jgi:ABC-type Fe3+-siderophore transport system permease subunit